MKPVFLTILLTIVLNAEAVSIIIPPTDSSLALVAKRKDAVKYYRRGEILQIQYSVKGELRMIKGHLINVTNDSLEVTPFGRKSISVGIGVSSIKSILRLKRKERQAIVITAVAAGLLLGAWALAARGESFSSWSFIIIFPAILMGYFVVFYFIGTYIDQLLNKKSTKRGWRFSTAMWRSSKRRFIWQKR